MNIRPFIIDGHTRPSSILLHLRSSLFCTFEHSENVFACKTGQVSLRPPASSDELGKLCVRDRESGDQSRVGLFSINVRVRDTWTRLPSL
jgi:hypothetical protein